MAKARARFRRLHELVGEWTSSSGPTQRFSRTRDLLQYLQGELYNQFQPGTDKPPFVERLEAWIQNVSNSSDQQCLFSFVPWILFVGMKEMHSMYQAAMTGPIARWIIDDAGLKLDDENLGNEFSREVKRTYFGSIANMDIGSFMKINGIQGQSLRVAYRDQNMVGNIDAFRHQTQDFDRYVAVEDMVGTGAQMEEAANYLTKLAPKHVLFCPLIVAPSGVRTWNVGIKNEMPHASFSPLFVIPENACLPKVRPVNHPEEMAQIHRIATDTWNAVRGTIPSLSLFGPFGCGEFGSLVVSYSNCPDNVPPFIHHDSDTWNALFPRNSREG